MARRKTRRRRPRRRRQCGARRRVGARDMGQSAAQHRPYAALPPLLITTPFLVTTHSLLERSQHRIPASNRDSSRPDPRTRVIVSFPKDNCLVREQIVTIVFTTPLRSLSLSPPNTFPRRLYRRYRPIGFDRKDRSSRLLAYLLVSKKRGRRGRRFPAEDRSTCRFRTQPLFDVDSNPHGNDELSPWERKLASTIDVFVTYARRGITNS